MEIDVLAYSRIMSIAEEIERTAVGGLVKDSARTALVDIQAAAKAIKAVLKENVFIGGDTGGAA